MSNNDREELEKKVTNSQIEEVDELTAISDQSIISFDNIIDELNALLLREDDDSKKREKIKKIAEENQKRLQDAEGLEQIKNKEEQEVRDNRLERQKPEQELNLILARKRQNVSDAYTELENAHQALESSKISLTDAVLVLAVNEANLNSSTKDLEDLNDQLSTMSGEIKELDVKVNKLLSSAETIKSVAQSELKDTTESEAQSELKDTTESEAHPELQKLKSEISDKIKELDNLSKRIEGQSKQCEDLKSKKEIAFVKYTHAQENHQKFLGVYKSAFEKYIGAVNSYNEGLKSEQQLGIPEFKFEILNLGSEKKENSTQLSTLKAYADDEHQENKEEIIAPNIQEELKKKEEESKKLSQEEKTALDRIAEAERFQPSSLSSQTSSSHKELDDTGDLESTKSELKKLLQETTSKYDSTIKKLSDMNYSDPFLNAFLVGRLANVRIAKFCKENELKKLIRESETMNPNDEQARVALRTRLNNFKSREECYNYTPLADLAEQGLQQIAGSANDLASYTNIYRAYNVMKSAFKNKNPDQDDDKSLNQRNSQQLP